MRIIYWKRATLCSYSHIVVAQNNNSDQGHILYLTLPQHITALFFVSLMSCTSVQICAMCIVWQWLTVWDTSHTELRLPPILLQHKCPMFATGIRIYYLKKSRTAVYAWYKWKIQFGAKRLCLVCLFMRQTRAISTEFRKRTEKCVLVRAVVNTLLITWTLVKLFIQ